MAKELECIIKTGSFTFHLGRVDEIGRAKGQLLLEYEPSSRPLPHTPTHQLEGAEPAEAGKGRRERWNLEQIGDFVRKLGFLDKAKEEEGGDKIKDFLHLSQVTTPTSQVATPHQPHQTLSFSLSLSPPTPQTVNKLFELYLKLRELGHPIYLSEDSIPSIPCSRPREAVNATVQDTQLLLTRWTQQVAELRACYSWLLYLSVPRMLQLHQLLLGPADLGLGERVDRIVHEVSFLAASRPEEIERLRQGVEVSEGGGCWIGEEIITPSPSLSPSPPSFPPQRALMEPSLHAPPPEPSSPRQALKSPMQVVGHFLNLLLQDHALPRRCSTKDLHSLPRHQRGATPYQFQAQPLYYCPSPSYSQLDFLCLILGVFSGLPEAYQVLRCHSNTTEEELSLFLKRVEQRHTHYLMLDVNKLPFKLQEVRRV